jgi:hypothetical protein
MIALHMRRNLAKLYVSMTVINVAVDYLLPQEEVEDFIRSCDVFIEGRCMLTAHTWTTFA